MIWQSISLMTVIDILILGIVGYAAAGFLRDRGRWPAHCSEIGSFAILGGLMLVALFYLADLLAMHAVPSFMPKAEAMNVMRELHLNGSWLVVLLGIGTICLGFTSVNRATAALVGDLEARERDLGRELAEHKRAEDALRESEARFRTLVEYAPEAITMLDVDTGLYLDANPMAEVLHGLPRDELIGKIGPVDLSPEIQLDGRPSSEAAPDYLSRALAGEFPKFEWMHLTPDGQETLCEVSLARLPDPHRKLVRASISDISERKAAEEALRESEARLSKATDMAKIGYWVWDKIEGKAIYCSDELARIYGVASGVELAAMCRSHVADLEWVHPDDQKRFDEAVRTANETKRGFDIEYRIINAAGEVRHLHNIEEPVLDERGEIIRSNGITQDITERKRAEEALRESEMRYRNLFDHAVVGIYRTAPDGRHLEVNPALARMRGCDSPAEFMAHFLNARHPIYVDPAAREKMSCLMREQGYVIGFESESYRRDGTRFWMSETGRTVRDQAGQFIGYEGFILDITDRKRAEEEIQKLNEDLERRVEERTAKLRAAQDTLLRNERLSTLGQLTATVSHELRNPLGVIRTSAFILRGKLSGGEPRAERALDRIERNVVRCDRIIDELLDFTRISQLAPEPTSLEAWLEETLSEQILPSGIALRLAFDRPDMAVSLDPDRFRRVIINVFDNACQAMIGESGEDTDSEEHALTVRTQEHDNRIEVIFEDTGPGIPPDVYEKIFEPLYSTKGFGVGLGLPVVKHIMEQHGGGIEIVSEEGRGTQVCLWLPNSRSTH
jgi:PAS domain S-box-containing protein